jgi:hypothetical protein
MPLNCIWNLIKEHCKYNKSVNDKKEKIGCPITLGEYEEIVRKEKEEENKE